MEEIKEITAPNQVVIAGETSEDAAANEVIVTEAGTDGDTVATEPDINPAPSRKKRVWPKVVLWTLLTPVLLAIAAVIVLFVILYGRIAT